MNFLEERGNVRVYNKEQAVASIINTFVIPVGPWNKIHTMDVVRKNSISFSVPWFGEGLYFSVMNAQYSNKMAVGHKKVYNYRLNNPNSGCTVKDVQNGINSLRNIKYIKSKLIVDGPAITNALNWHIWSNNYNLINFIYSASSINKYEKEYNSALRDLKLYAPKVLRHSEIGFKTKLSILLRTFFPITFIKRDNKKAKLAYEKDTME